MNPLFINAFLKSISGDLKRIASQTKGEFTYNDLENEAFLLLSEFADNHGRNLRLSDKEDTNWIISRLYNQAVKWNDHNFRNALRINQFDDEDTPWVLDLPAPANSNPLLEILSSEEAEHIAYLIEGSYSEAKAYVVTFSNFNYDKAVLSDYWHITSDTINKRFNRSIVVLENQPSLFDYLETIDESFNPIPGREKVKIRKSSEKTQLALEILD